jgi:chemotaxis protein MotB
MAKKKKKGGGGGGGADDSFALMFTSLNLILLSFFILLNAISIKDSERTRRAIGSLRGTFGILEGGENPWAEGKFLMRSDLIQTRREKGRKVSKLADRMALILRRMGLFDGNASAVAVRTADGLHLKFDDRVLFLSGRIEINPELFPTLDKIAKAITRAGQPVVVRGYTDAAATPNYPTNLELSASRAAQVARYLVFAAGVPAKLVTAEGRGVKRGAGEKRSVEIFVPESSLRAPLAKKTDDGA